MITAPGPFNSKFCKDSWKATIACFHATYYDWLCDDEQNEQVWRISIQMKRKNKFYFLRRSSPKLGHSLLPLQNTFQTMNFWRRIGKCEHRYIGCFRLDKIVIDLHRKRFIFQMILIRTTEMLAFTLNDHFVGKRIRRCWSPSSSFDLQNVESEICSDEKWGDKFYDMFV